MHALIQLTDKAAVLCRQNRLLEAEAVYEAVLRRAGPNLETCHWLAGPILAGYGQCLSRLARYQDAELRLLHSLALTEPTFGPRNSLTLSVVESLAELYVEWGKPDRARLFRARAAGLDHGRRIALRVLHRRGRRAAASPNLFASPAFPPDDPDATPTPPRFRFPGAVRCGSTAPSASRSTA